MAQKINSFNTSGIMKANAVSMQEITENEVIADVSGAQYAVTLLIDMPSGKSGEYCITAMPSDNNKSCKGKAIALVAEQLNYISVDTAFFKNDDGTAKFVFDGDVSSLGIKICIIKDTAVVNH